MSTSQVSQSGQVFLDGPTAKKINGLLNCTKTRLEGLRLLDVFLPQCPDEEFLICCVSWMQNCCKTDGSTKNTNYQTILLSKLLKISSNYPELKKSVSFFITTRYFDFFFKYLLSSEIGWLCTETCLCLYRGACGSVHETLEKHLTFEIEKNVEIPSTVARCFALLPATGGGGNEALNYKRNWKSQFVKFLTTCQSVLNDLFTDVEDFQEYVIEEGQSTNGREKSIEQLAILLENCCSVIGFMLLNEYPAAKNVPSDLVFQLICRGLSVSPKDLRRRSQTTESLSLQKVLPRIHCALFSLLKAVVVTCKNQLLPYSHLICKLIKQSLQWTESDLSCYGTEKQLVRVRISTYEALCEWLVVARSGSCVEVISDVVVSNSVNDIKSKEGMIFLKEATPQKQSKNKEQTVRLTDARANSELCRAALRALQFLLKFAGVLLKAELHKFLQEVVIKLVIEVQKRPPREVIPFAESTSRMELYSLLLELVHQPSLKWPPPTNFALKLFSRGVNDTSPQVSSFCSAALNFTTIIIHPQYDNGGFPPGYVPGSGSQGEKIRWRGEPVEVVSEKEPENSRLSDENRVKSKKTEREQSKKESEVNEGSEMSSDEDSRNTITFSKDAAAFVPETVDVEEGRKETVIGVISDEADRCSARQRSVGEKSPEQKTPSAVTWGNEPAESSPKFRQTPEMKKPSGSGDEPKNISPESGAEGEHPRGRYFLRSTRKGSSEEPEEALKRTNSAESLRGTPVRSVSKTTPGPPKRRRTRGPSKAEGSGEEAEEGTKGGEEEEEEEEDIRAAFDDSFVD